MKQKNNKDKKHIGRYIIFSLGIIWIGNSTFNYAEKQIRLNSDLKTISNAINMDKNEYNGEGEITVASVNSKNKYSIGDKGSEELIVELCENDVNIIGTQETTRKQVNELKESLNELNYEIVGDPRWGNGLIGWILNFANETNSIVGSEKIYMSDTITLPWIPKISEISEAIQEGSIMPRIATHCVIEKEGIGFIHVYNTHLDYGVDNIQRRQMEKLLNWIDENNKLIELPIIITGDMNATLESENMKWFIEELSNRNIEMVSIIGDTYKGYMVDNVWVEKPKQVDYIFASSNFIIKNQEIVENPDSDHNAIKTVLIYK